MDSVNRGKDFWTRFKEAEEISLIAVLLSAGIPASLIGRMGNSNVWKKFRRVLEGLNVQGDYWEKRMWVAIKNFLRTGEGASRLRQLGKEMVSSLISEIRQKGWRTGFIFTLVTVVSVVLPTMVRIIGIVGGGVDPVLNFGVLFPLLNLVMLYVLKGRFMFVPYLLLPLAVLIHPALVFVLPLGILPLWPRAQKALRHKEVARLMPEVFLTVSSLPTPHNIKEVFEELSRDVMGPIKPYVDGVLKRLRQGVDEESALRVSKGPLEWDLFKLVLLGVFKAGKPAAPILRIVGEELSSVLRIIQEEKDRLTRERYQILATILLSGPLLRMAEQVINVPPSHWALFYLALISILFGYGIAETDDERMWYMAATLLSPIIYAVGRV